MISRSIIAYENDVIKICNEPCDSANCEYCESKCCAEYFNEIKDLCDNDLLDGIKIQRTKNGVEIIKCGGYCGYFQLKDGVEILILPKVTTKNRREGEQIFRNLIFSAYNIKNVKIASDSDTDLNRKNLFLQILITIFCSFMEKLFKKGIKNFYSLQQENLPYLKGKLVFSEHVKQNITSKEKFYVEYDEFTDNIAENRILKSACEYLLPKSNAENKKLLRRFLFEFSGIEQCKNLDKDFAKIQPNRLYNHYNQPLKFAEVFLRNKSFNPMRGNKKFPALLFSMHDLFEDYIKNLLHIFKKDLNFDFKYQYSPYYLVSKNIDQKADMFNTKMDFILFNKNKNKAIIIDAKYKLINLKKDFEESKFNEYEEKNEENSYYNTTNINQRDLYQVFTYSEIIKKCDPNVKEIEIALLYPKTDKFFEKKTYYYFSGTRLTFIPINLTGQYDEILKNNSVLRDFIKDSLSLC